jgi:hypothetical protein
VFAQGDQGHAVGGGFRDLTVVRQQVPVRPAGSARGPLKVS